VLLGRIDETLQRKHRLAGSRATDEQARAVARESAVAQLIETPDARKQFGQRPRQRSFGCDLGSPLLKNSLSPESPGIDPCASMIRVRRGLSVPYRT
jgi:hypothetical protein